MRDDVTEKPRDPAWTSREREDGHGALGGGGNPTPSTDAPRAPVAARRCMDCRRAAHPGWVRCKRCDEALGRWMLGVLGRETERPT